MINNFCNIIGTVTDIYFDWANKGDKGDKIEFLRLMVLVKRNPQLQDATHFAYDLLRVVSYGELARKTYATLSVSQMVVVVGWLQCRQRKGTAVVEIVAWQIVPTGQTELSISPQLADQVRSLATQYHLEPGDLADALLMPQVEALAASLLDHTLDEELDGNQSFP